MNQDKAREFFSALYEGSLEPALKQSVESRLRSDPELQADYSAFVSTMEDLRVLPDEDIAVPVFLSDRISTRLEQEIARRPRKAPAYAGWLRGLAFAVLGAAAVGGAILSFRSSGRSSMANALPNASPDQPTFTLNGTSVVLNYHPGAQRTVVVSSGVTERELQRFPMEPGSPSHPFENRLAGTALFQIQVLGVPNSYLLAVPGTGGSQPNAATGTVRDFAVALATRYRMPVVLHAADTSKRFAWKLEEPDADSAAASVLQSEPFVVEERESGILFIGDR